MTCQAHRKGLWEAYPSTPHWMTETTWHLKVKSVPAMQKCKVMLLHIKMIQLCYLFLYYLSSHTGFRFVVWLKTLCTVLCSTIGLVIYSVSQPKGLVCFWAVAQTAERQKWSNLFPVFFLWVKSQILHYCSKENGRSKLKQIGKAPVFPRTICDQLFSNKWPVYANKEHKKGAGDVWFR